MNLVTAPEMLTVLLNVEALEDNEVLSIERVRYLTRISDPKHKATLDKLEIPQTVRNYENNDVEFKQLSINLNYSYTIIKLLSIDNESSRYQYVALMLMITLNFR